MVTNAGMTIVKEETNLPMVTVCPRYPNSANLMFNLLSWKPELISDESLTALKALMLKKALKESTYLRRKQSDSVSQDNG